MEGESKEAIAGHFRKMGYTPTLIEKASPGLQKKASFEIFFRRVNLEELIVFTGQLMTLQRAGVPILVSLESVRAQSANSYFKHVIQDISRDIEAGKALSDCMARFPDIFSEIYVNMIKAGETAGVLDTVLERLLKLLEHEQDIRMKIRQATRYPLLVIASIAVAFPLAVMFIIPKFTALFARLGTELPLPTRILLNLNFMLTHYWFLVLAGVVASALSFRYLINTGAGRLKWDGIKLKVPVFGPLISKISMSRFGRMTSVLSASGIPIIDTLRVVKEAVGNRVIANSVDHIIEGVEEGKGLAEPMKASTLFPAIVIQMVKIGEETGKIDELLLKVSDYYDSQTDYTVKNLTVLIEPILIFVMGILVLLLAMAIFMPMWSLISAFRH